jgi:hypothetical protein
MGRGKGGSLRRGRAPERNFNYYFVARGNANSLRRGGRAVLGLDSNNNVTVAGRRI